MNANFGGFQLPISRRGNFMSDDFFSGFQTDFDSAVQNVMSRFSGKSLLSDRFSRLRGHSDNQQQDDSNTASISDNKDTYVIVLDVSEFLNGSIAVKTKGQYAVVEASYQSKSFNRKFLLPNNTNIDGIISAMSDEGILTITAPKKNLSADASGSSPSVKNDTGEPITDGGPVPSSQSDDKNLSISKKGKFFDDAYFSDMLKNFEEAMDEKEQASKVQSQKTSVTESNSSARPQFTRLNSYRNMREFAPITETQAVTLTQDANGYKIVMDVKNFVGGPDRELNIKGSEGACTVVGSKGPLSFKRDFDLPGLKDPNQLQATVSEDGVLTILAKIQ